MTIYPAIDIRNGQCVRLMKGDFAQETVYAADPASVAQRWRDAGAAWLHLVDLDGARAGAGQNTGVIKRILAAADIPAQLGGGLRTPEDVRAALAMGVRRVILGTAAVQNPGFVREMAEKHGDQIAVGVDAINGRVAVSAWREVSDRRSIDFLYALQDMGIKTVVYTDIAKDGMLSGPNLPMYEEAARTQLHIIASGGVACMEDLARLYETGVPGVIIGKALYENTVDLREAVRLYA